MSDSAKLTPRDEAAMGTVTAELPADPLARLADAFVEDILATPDEEILAEMREDGLDPKKVAKHMRQLAEQAIAKHEAKAPDENGWMPIEDSKGGEIIAGWWSAGVWMIRAAWWFDGSRWKDQGFDCHDDARGWWSYVHSVGQEKIHPTHFLPHTALPNPPKE